MHGSTGKATPPNRNDHQSWYPTFIADDKNQKTLSKWKNTKAWSHVSVRQLRWCLLGSLCVCCFALGWLVGLSLRDLCCFLTEANRVGSAILVRVSPMFVNCCFGYSRFLLSCMGELVRVDMFVLHFGSSTFFCEKPRPVNFGRATVRDALQTMVCGSGWRQAHVVGSDSLRTHRRHRAGCAWFTRAGLG